MIYVDRNRVEKPEELESDKAQAIMADAEAFYSLPPEERKQRRFDFSRHMGWLNKVTRHPLIELFHGKCAFCESRVGVTGPPDLEQFRPKLGAVGLSGDRFPDHYWWLALQWENLYLACAACNRTKGNRFPVKDEALRARLGATWSELDAELALLIDPCRHDPGEHLVFRDDGTVSAVHVDDLSDDELDRFGTPTRGQVTIDTFGLNRSELVAERRNEAARFIEELHRATADIGDQSDALALLQEEALSPSTQYLQMKLQLMRAFVDTPDATTDVGVAIKEFLTSNLAPSAYTSSVDDSGRKRAFQQQQAYEEAMQASSVEDEDFGAKHLARTSYIERVEIHNFTSMDEFEFTFGGETSLSSGDAPWLMLLGENGVGKTSVLKAIALALAGPRRLAEIKTDQAMHDTTSLFREGGFVRLFLTSQSEPLEIRRVGDELVYEGDASGAKSFVRAFGPSRWFPQPGAQPAEDDDFVRIENLFNPFVPLESGEHFLTTLDPARWDDVAYGLKNLLQIGDEGWLSNDGSLVEIHIPGEDPQPIRALSAGYEAVFAMTMDLIEMLFRRWASLSDAEGIVLLDEIGSHLHPRWKMQIVNSLRATFPRVQFIATTHEPLCLRGLRDGEILIMKREIDAVDGESAKVIPSRPTQDVSKLRVDQLLTSRMFGLFSTLDPEMEEQFDRYYELLSRHESGLSPQDREELEELESTVGSQGILGSTRRDQLIYRLIDEFIAKEPSMVDETERAGAEVMTLEEAAEFWAKVPDIPEADA